MQIKMVNIDSIKPYPGNARINDQAVDAVAASLKEFGWQQPIVADTKGVIIVGHTRHKAAKKLGMAKVPVHVAKDLTAAQVRAYRLADNKSGELAEWDMDKLAIEAAALADSIDLSLFGFDLEAILAKGIPAGNKAIDETTLAETANECPSCGFKW